MLSHFSRVQLCATPQMAAHQAPLSLGFSRQEHWSGLPFPSPMHESEKWKWSRSVVSNSSQPHGLQPTRLLHPGDSPGKSTGVGCHCLLQRWSTVKIIIIDSILFFFHLIFTDILHNNSQLLLNVILVAYTWWLYNLTCTALGVGSMLYLFCRLGS